MSFLPLWITLLTLMANPSNAGFISRSQGCEPPSVEQAITSVRALNEQYIDAARVGDADWFADHMAEDVVVVLGSGRRMTKTDFLSAVRNSPTNLTSLTLRDVTIRVFGPTVQVDADAPWERVDGQHGISRYIDTYAWLDCRWQVISAQITLLPPTNRP